MNKDFQTRIQAVTMYINEGGLQETASRFSVHRTTLTRWKKWYKEGGEENLRKDSYKKPWNRFSKEIEEKVMLLKENNPSLTIRRAKAILGKEGIFISVKGIYSIWKRYNLLKRSPEEPLSPFGPLTLESTNAIERVENLLADKQNPDAVRAAAQVLNSLPSYPADKKDILKEIPEKFLSPRKKLDRLYSYILEIPALEFFKKLRNIRKSLEKNGYFYSATIAGLLEILALDWMHTPEEELRIISTLKSRIIGLYDPVLRFRLALFSAKAYAQLLQVENAYESAKKCRRLLRSLPYSNSLESYGVLMTSFTDYKEALQFYQMALGKETNECDRRRLLARIGHAYMMMGKYREAKKILTNKLRVKPQDICWNNFMFSQANIYFASGEFERASKCLGELLEKSKKEQLRGSIYSSSLCLAAIAIALGKVNESKITLKKYLPLLEKYGLKWKTTTIKFLIEKRLSEKKFKKFRYINHIHFLHLLDKARRTLKVRDYQSTVDFAESKGLVNYFHRLIVFFPEIIVNLFQKGRDTGLPKSILRFPVFIKEVLVYHLKILGNIVVQKNQRHLRLHLTPIEKAFLIHLALRAGEPGKFIPVNDLYNNFWSKSKKPSYRLHRIAQQVKQKLKIPNHLIDILAYDGWKRLMNQGIYITTDYNDFVITLTQARALERTGEWHFARERYLQAFKLIRGEPFSQMYDNWSEDMRWIILNQLESAAINFANACLAHRNQRDAIKVLKKVSEIIPYSDEIKHLLSNLITN